MTQSPTAEMTVAVPAMSPLETVVPAVATTVNRPVTVLVPPVVGIFRTKLPAPWAWVQLATTWSLMAIRDIADIGSPWDPVVRQRTCFAS